jgi:methylphosphotriester-DNA--protein-cysteine methyltransferase
LAELERLAVEAGFEINRFAKLAGRQPAQMRRVFRRCVGMPPRDWLGMRRILYVQSLLLAGLSVKQCAEKAGFRNSPRLCERFKAMTGLRPRQFVAAVRAGSHPRPLELEISTMDCVGSTDGEALRQALILARAH